MSPLLAVLLAVAMQMMPPTRSIDRGAQSRIESARQAAIRDRDAWDVLWRTHAPDRPQPAVDFSREIVVGVFLGLRPTAGYAVDVVGFYEMGDDVVVQYRETTPARDSIAAQVVVSPYHIVTIPKKSGKVTFSSLAQP